MTHHISIGPRRTAAMLLLVVVLAACQATTEATHAPQPGASASAAPASTSTASTAPTSAADPGALPALGDVPMYKVDLARTGVNPGPGPVAIPVEAWSRQIECLAGGTSAALASGLLIVGCDAARLVALDARTGAVVWTAALEGPLTVGGTPTVADGVIYVGTGVADGAGTFDALDLRTGKPRWSVKLDTVKWPVVTDGRIYVGSTDGRYVALDPANGHEVWSWSSPINDDALVGTVLDGTAYLCGNDNHLYAVDIATGGLRWQQRGTGSRFSSATISGDTLVTGSQPDSPLVAFDLATGAERWPPFNSPSGRQVSPATIADGVIYAPSALDGLFAIDLATGKQLWNGKSGDMSGQAPAIAGDLVYLVTSGDLRAFDRASGTLLWTIPLHASVKNGPVVSGGMVFTSDDSGWVRAFAEPGLVAQLAGAAHPPTATPTPGASPTEAPTASATAVIELVGTFDAAALGLDRPTGIDVGPDGNLYVVNASKDEIVVLSPEGKVVRRWGGPGSKEGQLDFVRDPQSPGENTGGVAVGADGRVYVSDTVNRRVQVFSPDGTSLPGWGRFGSADGQFLEPYDIAVGPEGDVFVVDDKGDDIQRFAPDGTHKATIGSHGPGPGQLSHTGGIGSAPDGTLLNADWDNQRIQAWKADNSFAWTFGSPGRNPGQFANPNDIDGDAAGRVFVADDGRLQVLGADRTVLGELQLGSPDAFLASDGDLLYVALPFANRILKLRVLG